VRVTTRGSGGGALSLAGRLPPLSTLLRHWLSHSGVARAPCALGKEIFLRPLSTKTTEFEVKNRRKSAEAAKFVIFFEDNKKHLVLEMNFDKAVIVGGSNNAGVRGLAPSRRRPTEFRGRTPRR